MVHTDAPPSSTSVASPSSLHLFVFRDPLPPQICHYPSLIPQTSRGIQPSLSFSLRLRHSDTESHIVLCRYTDLIDSCGKLGVNPLPYFVPPPTRAFKMCHLAFSWICSSTNEPHTLQSPSTKIQTESVSKQRSPAPGRDQKVSTPDDVT